MTTIKLKFTDKQARKVRYLLSKNYPLHCRSYLSTLCMVAVIQEAKRAVLRSLEDAKI